VALAGHRYVALGLELNVDYVAAAVLDLAGSVVRHETRSVGADGPLGTLTQRERFHWLVAPRSAAIQTSAVHTGRCADPAMALDHLVRAMVLVGGSP
jgi:hypothetical protein